MTMNYPNVSTPPVSEASSSNPVEIGNKSIKRILVIGHCQSKNIYSIINGHDVVFADSFPRAAYYLQHLSANSNEIPDVIVGFYIGAMRNHLREFAGFLHSDTILSEIPFILFVDEALAPVNYKPSIGIDDIVRENISSEEFIKKVTLLKKFKALRKWKGSYSSMHYNGIRQDRKALYRIDMIFRRLMDILLSSFTLIILSPLLLVIAVIIKLDSRGPVFYTSYRAGSNYRIFKFIKFRTMVAEADNKLFLLKKNNQYGKGKSDVEVFFKIHNDPRITKVGRFLRNSSLDELPQLFNVLKADMSLVGNRPLPLYEAKVLTTDNHAERFNAPAGITGLWQISKRGQRDMSAEERIALDIDYARNNSLANDIQIILRTPRALIQKDNV